MTGAADGGRDGVSEPAAGAPARAEGATAARWILIAALAIGLVRFWKLGAWSLWFDEAATWTDWFVGIDGGEIKNPLGYRLVHATVELLGGVPDERALRFLPALAGWLCVGATAWAFRPIAGARASAIAALFVAASSWQTYWSQNARFYTLAELATLVGTGLFLRAVVRAGATAPALTTALLAIVGLAVAASAALFHASAAMLLPALLVAAVVAARRARVPIGVGKRALLFAGGIALGAALVAFPWAKATLVTYLRQKGDASPFDDLGETAARVLHLARTCGFYFTPWLVAAALAGGAFAWARRERGGALVLVATIVAALLAAAAATWGARMSAQYLFFLFPWVALLAALPAERLLTALPVTKESRALACAWVFVLTAGALTSTALYFTVRKGERPEWREAYQFVWNRREPNDLVLGMEATVGELYVAPWRTDLRQPEHVQWLDKWRARLPELWSRRSRRMWLVVNPEQFLDWSPSDAAEVQRFLREECRLVKCWPLYVESRDLSVWVYVRD